MKLDLPRLFQIGPWSACRLSLPPGQIKTSFLVLVFKTNQKSAWRLISFPALLFCCLREMLKCINEKEDFFLFELPIKKKMVVFISLVCFCQLLVLVQLINTFPVKCLSPILCIGNQKMQNSVWYLPIKRISIRHRYFFPCTCICCKNSKTSNKTK